MPTVSSLEFLPDPDPPPLETNVSNESVILTTNSTVNCGLGGSIQG
jgi:hypothetical protein